MRRSAAAAFFVSFSALALSLLSHDTQQRRVTTSKQSIKSQNEIWYTSAKHFDFGLWGYSGCVIEENGVYWTDRPFYHNRPITTTYDSSEVINKSFCQVQGMMGWDVTTQCVPVHIGNEKNFFGILSGVNFWDRTWKLRNSNSALTRVFTSAILAKFKSFTHNFTPLSLFLLWQHNNLLNTCYQFSCLHFNASWWFTINHPKIATYPRTSTSWVT